MRKKSVIFFCILGISFLFFMSCKEKEKKMPEPKASTSAGDLQVTSVTPKGQTSAPHESERIVVIFNQPMVPLKALSDGKDTSVLIIDPSFSGKYRWMGTKILTFIPDKRFPYSTEIKIRVPAGIRSLNNYVLKQDFTWSFSTIRPRLVEHNPRNKQKWVRLDTRVLLVFNQPVRKESTRDFIALTGINKKNEETSLDFTLKSLSKKQLEEEKIKALPEEVLLIEPQEKFHPDFRYYVEVKAGLQGKEGILGMEKSRIFQFETFKEFEFVSMKNIKDHDPYDPLKFHFTNPVLYNNFVQNIRFSPEISIPGHYSRWTYGSSTLWLTLPLQPETDYTLWIGAELEDEFGNSLGREIKLNFNTSSFPPSVSMTTGHGILEAYGALFYPFYALNTQEVFFQGTKVLKKDVIPLLTSPKIFWTSEKYYKKNFFQVEKTLKLSIPRNKRQIFPIDLKEFLPGKYGLLFIQMDTQATEDKWSRYPKAFLQVTELGISAKFSPENNLIWVTELKTGQPVVGAKAEIRDDFNKIQWRGKTDAEGKVNTPGWKTLGIKSKDKWRKPRQWVFIEKDEDLALISSEWGTGIYPYRFGIQYDWNPQPVELQGYIYTERGIYRAGEKVYIKGIIRKKKKGQWRLPDVEKITCEVYDPFQKTVFKENIQLDSFGSFSFNLETDDEVSLGRYRIKAEIPPASKGQKSTKIYGSFRVEAFRPAEFEVLLHSKKQNFVFKEDYEAEIRASYLFGGAMAGQKVSWHLRLNPARFAPPGFKGYTFGNQIDIQERDGRQKSRLLASGDSTLDSKGELKIKAKLLPEKETDSVLAALEVTVEGPSRRTISSRIQNVVHKGEYYIGLKPSTTFLKAGKELAVNVITSSPEGKILPEKKTHLEIIKREWHSVRKAGIGGRFQWLSEPKDTKVAEKTFQTKNEPHKIHFTPDKSGFYIIRAEGKDSRKNTITTTTYFYVTGKDYVPWKRKDDDTVELVADKKDYAPGDTAKILVKSPYEKAKALVTLEREFILESRVLDIYGSSSEIEVPILSEHIPNVFVSVLLVQGRTSRKAASQKEDIGKPSFKLGYINLKVDPSEKRLKIEIQKNKNRYKPGDEVTLNLKIRDWKGLGTRASVSLAVVDIGVLNLTGFQTPDPFTLFYRPKPLSVQTSDLRLHVVGQRAYGEKGENVGGGVGEEKKAPFAALAEVELRGDFKTTAYWNPSVVTDENGNASLSFPLPDNLTTFRIMAVAQTTQSQFGRGEETFKVSKPLLLKAAFPRFARLGDKFKGGVVVHNYSPIQGDIILSCQAEGILLLDRNNTRQFSLKQGEGKEILFSFQAESPGKARLSFRAKMGDESDGLEITLPIKMPRPTETVALFSSTERSTKEEIHIPEDIFPDFSKIEVQASSTALSGLKGSLDYLSAYPYLCLEQLLSSVLPYIVSPDVILDFNLSKFDAKKMREHVQTTLKKIYSYQKRNGGFSLWPDSSYDSPFITCYAFFALTKARKAGYKTDKQRMEEASIYLKNLIRKKRDSQSYPYTTRTWKTIQAFVLYDLALFKQPEPSYAETLFEERDSISLFGQALLLKALHEGKGSLQAQNVLLQGLLNKIKVTPAKAHFEDDEGRNGGWIYSTSTRTTAFILQSMIEVGYKYPLLPAVARWLVERRKAGRWSSTQENFFVFYALNDFYSKYEKVEPDFQVEIRLAKKLLLKELFKGRGDKTAISETLLTQFKTGKAHILEIKKKGPGTLYYGARMTYAPSHKLPARDEGFAVYKKITSLKGEPLNFIKAGDLVVVTLQVAVPMESLFVVIEDPLPAGLEAVNPTFITESREQQKKLESLYRQRQRLRWWEGFNHIEMHDDRVLLFADILSPGIHSHSYLARALTFGRFLMPGTKAEGMYTPEVFGRSSELAVEIK